MELGRIELPSEIAIDFLFVHRFSLSDPQGGNRSLSRTMGCSGKFLAREMTRGITLEHPLGFGL